MQLSQRRPTGKYKMIAQDGVVKSPLNSLSRVDVWDEALAKASKKLSELPSLFAEANYLGYPCVRFATFSVRGYKGDPGLTIVGRLFIAMTGTAPLWCIKNPYLETLIVKLRERGHFPRIVRDGISPLEGGRLLAPTLLIDVPRASKTWKDSELWRGAP